MKKIYSAAILIASSFSLLAQRGYDDYMDEEDTKDFERYAHLGLSKGEITSIIIGIVLLLIAKNMTDRNPNLRLGLGCVGVLCALPLVLVILAVAQKAIGYAIILALVVGGLYFLFGQNK
jgi:hypothetical protein